MKKAMADTFYCPIVDCLIRNGTMMEGCHPEVIHAAKVCESIYYDVVIDANSPYVITSGREGAHSDGSRHYLGYAFDVRTRNTQGNPQQFPIAMKQILANRVRTALGANWR
jgi:hypothetical protein